MDSFEWNKMAGWTLGAVVVVMGITIVTGAIFTPEKPAKPGYIVEGVEEAEAPAAAAETEKPIEFYLASANVTGGEAQFKKCAVCHTIAKGAAHGIGPNLWGIVGNHHAHEADFSYSSAMQATAAKTWDWEALSAWIQSPAKYIPNNKMAFAGLAKPQDRANLIAYLNSQSDAPLPLPAAPAEAEAAPAADAEAPADAAAPAEGEAADAAAAN